MNFDNRYGQAINRLLWWEPFYIAFLALPLTLPTKIIPSHWHWSIIVALFLGWLLRWLIRHQAPLYYTSLRWPLLLMLAWLPVNIWVAIDRSAAWVATGYLLLGVAFYVALINWPPAQRHPHRIAYGLCMMGFLLTLFAPPFIQWKPRFRLFHLPFYDRFGTIGIDGAWTETIHANVLAGVLVMILPLLAAFLLYKRPHVCLKIRFLGRLQNCIVAALWFGTILLTGLLILTQSRGAYLAGFSALGIIALFRWQYVFYLLPLVGLGIGWAIRRLGLQDIFELLGADNTFGGAIFRNEVWGNSVYALSDFVFTGIGLGNFNQIVPKLYPFAQIDGSNAYHAHNLYLQIGLDLGLPGAIAYGALIIHVFVWTWVVQAQTSSTLTRVVAIGTFGSLVAMLVHGLLDAVTWGTKLVFVPWIFYAQVMLLARKETGCINRL